MDKTYQPQQVEQRIYQLWERGGHFTPQRTADKKPFCIIMPPPNANDPLHLGHAMFVVIEDILIRYHRLRGEATLWLPGSDHAGIETQYVFEKKLQQQGKSRFDFTREEFYKTVYDYVTQNTTIMTDQLRKLGASCDWSRFKFTLDPEIINIVYDTFFELYRDGLVYRSERMINFCPRCGTSFSDLEVKDKVQKDPLYYMKYGPFTLATVRPETKFGDTAVAVNPKDKRYKKWVGKEIEVAGLLGKFRMKVIADEAVDPKFGTGVIKVTPAHDPVDFEIGKRHGLEVKRVIDFNGRLNDKAGKYQGLKVLQAREVVAQDLNKQGLIVKIDETYEHAVKTCYRCNTILEPMILPQWFVKVDELKRGALEVVAKGEIKILPRRFVKQYLHWMQNLRDWNISRQIWWGIPIPAWYCADCTQIEKLAGVTYIPKDAPVIVSPEKPDKCSICSGANLLKDPDTFDTWFSSGQWPFATLMTTQKGDFDYFYPTSVLETLDDILYLWVARMIMLGLYKTKKIPFRDVYLHAKVVDKYGVKMSKSKGNVLDPIEVVNKYGADVLRLALIWGVSPGANVYISEEKLIGMRNFANKLWNIARFMLMNLENKLVKRLDDSVTSSEIIKWCKKLTQEQEQLTQSVSKYLDTYRLSQALEKIYDYTWHTLADKHLEKVKPWLREESEESPYVRGILLTSLETVLKLLHPFVPFVTEEIWSKLPNRGKELLISTSWPAIEKSAS